MNESYPAGKPARGLRADLRAARLNRLHAGSREARTGDRARRMFDVAAAAAGLILVSPLLAAIAVAIRLQDGGPVLYLATRVGRDGKLFHLYKFRTMIVGADQLGAGITCREDARITRLGKWLRRTKLDELPQLINVLAGDMSLVGPRPEDPRYIKLYTPKQREVLGVRPGITSLASLEYRAEEQMLAGPNWETLYTNEVIPAKLAIELDYLAKRTLRSDISVLIRTVVPILK